MSEDQEQSPGEEIKLTKLKSFLSNLNLPETILFSQLYHFLNHPSELIQLLRTVSFRMYDQFLDAFHLHSTNIHFSFDVLISCLKKIQYPPWLLGADLIVEARKIDVSDMAGTVNFENLKPWGVQRRARLGGCVVKTPSTHQPAVDWV